VKEENLTSLEAEFVKDAAVTTDLLPNSAEIAKETVEKEKGFLHRSIDKLVKSIRKTTDKFRALGIVGSIGASVVLEWFGAGIEIAIDIDTDTKNEPLPKALPAVPPQLVASPAEQ